VEKLLSKDSRLSGPGAAVRNADRAVTGSLKKYAGAASIPTAQIVIHPAITYLPNCVFIFGFLLIVAGLSSRLDRLVMRFQPAMAKQFTPAFVGVVASFMADLAPSVKAERTPCG